LSNDILDDDLEYSRDEKRTLNLFDWKDEFKSVFNKVGFDCLIENPPYVSIQNMINYNHLMVKLLKENFKSAESENINIYPCFVKQSLKLIKKDKVIRL